MAKGTRPCADGKRKEGILLSQAMEVMRREGRREVSSVMAHGREDWMVEGSSSRLPERSPVLGVRLGAGVSEAGRACCVKFRCTSGLSWPLEYSATAVGAVVTFTATPKSDSRQPS